MGFGEALRQAGAKVFNAAISPLMDKPKNKITWRSRKRWRTFTNDNGEVRLTRFNKKPKDAHEVGSYVKAIEKAQEAWGIDIDSRGQLVQPAETTPPVAEPLFNRADAHREAMYLLRYQRPARITRRPARITPRTPRLR